MLRMRHALAKSPAYQAERIGSHYVAMAQLALGLKKYVEMRKRTDDADQVEQLDQAIEFHVRKIRESHQMDLGLDLYWENSTNTHVPTHEKRVASAQSTL